jgi:hypothetical protein
MAYSKVRWISTLAFLACVGGAHGREEGAKRREWLRWVCERPRGGGARTSWEGVCAPQPAVCAPLTSICAPPATVCAPQSSVCVPYASVCAPLTGICALPPVYAPLNQPYAPAATPTIQRGSDVAATVDKVSPDLPCPRSTRR